MCGSYLSAVAERAGVGVSVAPTAPMSPGLAGGHGVTRRDPSLTILTHPTSERESDRGRLRRPSHTHTHRTHIA